MSKSETPRECIRCKGKPPLHEYPLAGGIMFICTPCWEGVTGRKWNHAPPINPLGPGRAAPGIRQVQPWLL